MIFQSENLQLEASEGPADTSESVEVGNFFDDVETHEILPKVSHAPDLYPPDVAAALAFGLLQEGVKIPQSMPRRRGSRTPSIALPIEEFPVHRIMDFWRGVDRGFKGIDDCWPWKRAACTGGYGRFKIFGRLYSTHRIAYALTKGGVPAGPGHHGHMVCHTCDNPPCCNPRHLFLGDAKANAQDMAAKGRCHTQQRPPPHPQPQSREGGMTPASQMTDDALRQALDDMEARWREFRAGDCEGSGSPGEWMVERMDELETEIKRRAGRAAG